MLTPLEIYNATRGAIRLLRFDPAGVFYFDNTIEAFWRSFRVMVLVAPLYVVLRLLDYANVSYSASDFEVVLVESFRYVVEWFFYPVLLLELSRWLNVRQNYLRYIVACNWINVPLLLIAIAAMTLGDLLPPIRAAMHIGLNLLVMIWFTAATRLVLGAPWPLTFGLLVVTTFMSIVFNLFVHDVLGIVLP
jgi:hypothetical protein